MNKIRFVFVAMAFLFLTAGAHAQVLVVANPNLPVESISKEALAKIYTGASGRAGVHILPVLLKEGPVHTEFLSSYVGKSPIGLIVAWRGLVLSGQAVMPKSFESEVDLVKYVSQTPGAIGYIGKDTPHSSVKVLTVE